MRAQPMHRLPALLDGAKDNGWACNCPQVLAVTSTCKAPEAAMKFLDYFFNSDDAESTLAACAVVPPTAKARESAKKTVPWTEHDDRRQHCQRLQRLTNDKYSSAPESKQIIADTSRLSVTAPPTPQALHPICTISSPTTSAPSKPQRTSKNGCLPPRHPFY